MAESTEALTLPVPLPQTRTGVLGGLVERPSRWGFRALRKVVVQKSLCRLPA